jgi:tRNA(Ile)-lysidine synthetase-like protein
VVARPLLREYDTAIAARVLRKLLRRFGIVPGGTGTRRALQFIIGAPSGRVLELPEHLRVAIEFDDARFSRSELPSDDQPLVLHRLPEGAEWEGKLRLGGRSYVVSATVLKCAPQLAEDVEGYRAALQFDRVRFPCSVRAWQPGDRLRTAGGTKRLKKLFLERRVPRSERRRLPVLADSTGRVLWVGGIGVAPDAAPRPGEAALIVSMVND